MSSAPAAELNGRAAEQRTVSGHLKRQRYGEGRALTKWIYVEQYEARRWFASRWVVSGQDEPAGWPRGQPARAGEHDRARYFICNHRECCRGASSRYH